MHMHSYFNGSYLIVGFDIGSWSRNGWPLASELLQSGGQHSGCSIETVRYCYRSMRHAQPRPGASQNLITYRTCLPADVSIYKRCGSLEGRCSRLIQDVTSSLSLGGIPMRVGPLLCSCSSHFLTVFLSLLYYLLAITHSSVCNSQL